MKIRNTIKRLFLIGFVFLLWEVSVSNAKDSVTLINDQILDTNKGLEKNYDDKSIRVDYRQIYATGYFGNYQTGWEAGGYLKGLRKSVYSGYAKFRDFDHTFQLETDQVLMSGFVGKAEVRYINVMSPEIPTDPKDLYLYGVGFDKYYGDYNYFSAEYFSDPKVSSRFSVMLSNTLANEYSSIRLGVVPRSDGNAGYFALVKYHWMLLGYSFTKEIDYSSSDRRLFSLGMQIPFDLKW